MVGRSSVNFLSEEERLQAQRRMLAERFGLLDNDDDGDGTDQPQDVDQAKAASSSNSPSDDQASNELQASENPAKNDGLSVSESVAPFIPTENGAQNLIECVGAAVAPTPSDQIIQNHDSVPDGNLKVIWPGVLLYDGQADEFGNMCPFEHYDYDASAGAPSTAKREVRVTQIAMYNSMLQNSTGRRIAVNDKFICYAVGGHVRVFARNSTERILLKGHGSAVTDMELAHMSDVPQDGINFDHSDFAVLASLAEDGSVLIWKLARKLVTSTRDEEEVDEKISRINADTLSEPVENVSLELVDSIRLEHPVSGHFYQGIGFRPNGGAVLSSKGIGVALLMLDNLSPDLRMTELVKMEEKTMALDKSFSGGHKSIVGTGLVAAVWISANFLATARGHEVCIWSASDQKCLSSLDRSSRQNSHVHSLIAVGVNSDEPTVVLACDDGRRLELWSFDPKNAETKLKQSICLYPNSAADVYNVVSRDAIGPEFVVVSNIKGKALFILHFNRVCGCFDAITEIPVKQPVLSLCVTRDVSPASRETDTRSGANVLVEELSIWCVQPRSIQKLHVFAQDCAPPRSAVINTEPKLLTSASAATAVPSDANNLSSSTDEVIVEDTPSTSRDIFTTSESNLHKLLPRSRVPSGIRKPITGNMATKLPTSTPEKFGLRNVTPPIDMGTQSIELGSNQKEAQISKSVDSVPTDEGSMKTKVTTKVISQPVSSISGISEKPAVLSNEGIDEIVAAVIAAANKVVAEFDNEGIRRQTAEMNKIDKLTSSVRETIESNMSEYVAEAIQAQNLKPLYSVVTDIVSKASLKYDEAEAMSTAAQSAISQASTLEPSADWFCEVFRLSKVNASFQRACKEMSRQSEMAIKTSLGEKYGALVKPSVTTVEESSEELMLAAKGFTSTVNNFIKSLEAMEILEDEARGSLPAETISETVGRLVREGNVNEAFQCAVSDGTDDDVIWLCKEFEPETFFAQYTLTQSCLLIFAKRLGEDMSAESLLKVKWLSEILLAVDSDDADGDVCLPPILEGVRSNVEAFRKDVVVKSDSPELSKKTKGLLLLLSSLLN